MARPPRPAWKDIVLTELAIACDRPGGSVLLRRQYAVGAAAILGYTEKTVCKYVETLLNKHPYENW